jgi:electron transfer flavoprotein alpha subunit
MKILLLRDANENAAKSAVTAANQLGLPVDIANCEGLLAEQIAPAIAAIGGDYKYIVTTATSFGKDVMPRIAAILNAPQISEVIEVVDATTFKRPIYAGNAIETLRVDAPCICLTIRQSAFEKAENIPAMNITISPAETSTTLVRIDATPSTRPELGSACVVIAGGRGIGSAEGFKILEQLADKLGAAIGASRAAVDAGYAPNDYQVGQTGKVVAPELYLAVGISGAIQHVAGMKDSKIVVAINKDENAPIFEIADYGLVADLHTAIPELNASL